MSYREVKRWRFYCDEEGCGETEETHRNPSNGVDLAIPPGWSWEEVDEEGTWRTYTYCEGCGESRDE